MKVILTLLVTLSILSANMAIFDKYRQGKEWQQDVDKVLFSDEYINYLLKNKDVRFGYYDNPINIIVCYKNKRKLDVYRYNNKPILEKQFSRILTGKNPGDKWVEGDGKTPIGVYELKYKIDDNELNDFYGPLAYPTNYPNLYDLYRGKKGHGIWIHGFPKDNPNRDFNTKGCIALPNNELINFSDMINYKNSILIIDTNNLPTTNKKNISIILKELFKWRYAWKYNKLNSYLSFYDKKNFKKENRFGFNYFAYIKKKIFARQKSKIIKFSNLEIIPYPSKDKNLYKVDFDEYFKSGNTIFQGKKILYLRLINNKISIFLEN